MELIGHCGYYQYEHKRYSSLNLPEKLLLVFPLWFSSLPAMKLLTMFSIPTILTILPLIHTIQATINTEPSPNRIAPILSTESTPSNQIPHHCNHSPCPLQPDTTATSMNCPSNKPSCEATDCNGDVSIPKSTLQHNLASPNLSFRKQNIAAKLQDHSRPAHAVLNHSFQTASPQYAWRNHSSRSVRRLSSRVARAMSISSRSHLCFSLRKDLTARKRSGKRHSSNTRNDLRKGLS